MRPYLRHGREVRPFLRREDALITKERAWAEAEETRSWVCQSCDVMVEAEGPHCRSCAMYWEDVSNGLFDDDWTLAAREEEA